MLTQLEKKAVRISNVVVALSGGIDSALAAATLIRAGWEVQGLHFVLPDSIEKIEAKIAIVQEVAHYLGIRLTVMDMREIFTFKVADPFVTAYLRGMTPNPCVACNPLIKFEALLRYAEENRIERIATGHYARLGDGKEGVLAELLRGKDSRKEQSYFLHRLGQEHLSKAIFPLGCFTKDQSRQLAGEMNLPVHAAPESQEICFLSHGDYRGYIEARVGDGVNKRGHIIDTGGRVLGVHAGSHRYTIGQRQGLGIASSRAYYVKEIRPETNEVVVGRREELFSKVVEAESFNWVAGLPSDGKEEAEAQVRYRHRAARGRLEVLAPSNVRFTFFEPQWAVAPGQALACYDGERVLGGGWIKRMSNNPSTLH